MLVAFVADDPHVAVAQIQLPATTMLMQPLTTVHVNSHLCWLHRRDSMQLRRNSNHRRWFVSLILARVAQTRLHATIETATIDDGSCESDSCAGCTDPDACNYDETQPSTMALFGT